MKKNIKQTLVISVLVLLMGILSAQTDEEILDQSQTVHDYGFAVPNTYDRWQTVIPTLDNLTKIEVFLQLYNATGTLIIKIQSENGDTTYAENTVDVSELPQYDWFVLTYDDPLPLTPDTMFRIAMIRSDAHTPQNYIAWRGDPNSSYPGYCDVNPAWENYDYAFKTYGNEFVSVKEIKANTLLKLDQNIPNPFSGTTTIKYHVAKDGQVSLKIYDISGKEIRTLVYENQNSGNYTVTWNGKDSNGNPVENGIYLFRLSMQDGSSKTRTLVLKR